MCERDNDYAHRVCINCGKRYYGPLGHGCYKGSKKDKSLEATPNTRTETSVGKLEVKADNPF